MHNLLERYGFALSVLTAVLAVCCAVVLWTKCADWWRNR